MAHSPEECGEDKGAEPPGERRLNTTSCLCHSYFHKHSWSFHSSGENASAGQSERPSTPSHLATTVFWRPTAKPFFPLWSPCPSHLQGLEASGTLRRSRQTSLSTGAELVHVFALWCPHDWKPLVCQQQENILGNAHEFITHSMLPGFTLSLHFHKHSSVMRKLSCPNCKHFSNSSKWPDLVWGVFQKESTLFFFLLIGQNSVNGFVYFFSLPVFIDMKIS